MCVFTIHLVTGLVSIYLSHAYAIIEFVLIYNITELRLTFVYHTRRIDSIKGVIHSSPEYYLPDTICLIGRFSVVVNCALMTI